MDIRISYKRGARSLTSSADPSPRAGNTVALVAPLGVRSEDALAVVTARATGAGVDGVHGR